MSLNQQPPPDSTGQSLGYDPKSSKRNSGLFAFLKWFKPSTSRESIDADVQVSESSSSSSLNSVHSAGTVASFSFVHPSAYEKCISEKCIALEPETDTYKARLKQRDKRRENDKNLTLRKKYNLFFNRDTFLKPKPPEPDEENTKSLPLMTRATMEIEEDIMVHRRTNSESSKIKKSGAYLHVKGKRKAPQPPGLKDGHSTTSLRRKKRVAPTPPAISPEKVVNTLRKVSKVEMYQTNEEIICNDSLKLDHGILKSAKDTDNLKLSPDQNSTNVTNSPTTSARSSCVEAPVSPRPWYKRNTSRESITSTKKEHKYEQIERLPEVPFMRNSVLDLTLDEPKPEKKKEEKRKSGMSFLTNISELDREASEIIKNKEMEKNGFGDIQEMPEFMRPKDTKINTDSWVSPKRRSARDLIAKFNAITNVTKVTVNSAFFGASQKDSKLFGKQASLDETKRRQESLLESHKKRLEEIDKKNSPLMKSESASAIKAKPETPKLERKSWKCPKCNLENEYWRIICHVCSAIKPYFDDFSSGKTENKVEIKTSSPLAIKREKTPPKKPEINMERSKTQIGFSALASYNANNKNKLEKTVSIEEKSQADNDIKKVEREKLKKMLIEMKNSLPKRKSNIMMKQNSRTSVIVENPESIEVEINATPEQLNSKEQKDLLSKIEVPEKTQEEKVAEILIGTTQTIYENIKVRKTDNPKPVKISAEAQTSAATKQLVPPSIISHLVKEESKKNNYELMRPKDFEDIYADNNANSAVRIYANLARNDELSLFFNMPKNFNNIKNNISQAQGVSKTDTIEINRLLRRLETSIAKGELTEAASFAKELAQLKVNCSVIRQKPQGTKSDDKRKGFQIDMYVEDKISHRGPFPIEVTADQTVAELKMQIEKEFEIPADYQKWILGKELVTDENSTLKNYNITTEGCPVFLYLVAPDPKNKIEKPKSPKIEEKNPSASSTVIPATTETKDIIKEEKPSKSTAEKEIEKMKMNVQNLQKKLNESKEVKKIEIQSQKLNPASTKPASEKPIESKTEVKNIEIQSQKPSSTKPIGQINVQSTKNVNQPTNSALQVTNSKSVAKSTVHSTNVLPGKELSSSVTIQQPPVMIDHTPKIIKVIPKLAESKPKTEIIIPVVVEEKSTKAEPKPKRVEKPISVTEIKIEEKQVPPTPKFQIRDSKSSDFAFPKARSPPKSNNNVAKQEGSKIKKAEQKVNSEVPVQRPQRKSESKEAPKAKEEDMEDYDSNTLKPVKEWECHLCTLLNPISSNICAVCATVRLSKAQPPKKSSKKKAPQPKVGEASVSKDQTYLQLVNLDNADFVENVEPFECVVCFLETPPREGVTLRECLHQFCKACLAHTIEYNEEAEVKCPYRDDDYSCNIALQDREIKALVSPAVYEQHLAKSVAQAENKMDKSFHCKTPDCKGWCVFEDNVNEFRCPVCRKTNCLTCQAIHMGVNCKQYQERMKEESEIDEDARRTRAMLNEMVERGEAIECPTCKVILMKKWGCDWLRCSMCKTEICWVTRGPRWGPAGKGDTSGGCQCGINGVKCHPKCNYCH